MQSRSFLIGLKFEADVFELTLKTPNWERGHRVVRHLQPRIAWAIIYNLADHDQDVYETRTPPPPTSFVMKFCITRKISSRLQKIANVDKKSRFDLNTIFSSLPLKRSDLKLTMAVFGNNWALINFLRAITTWRGRTARVVGRRRSCVFFCVRRRKEIG